MSANVILGVVGSAVVLVAILEMMRRHRLREKYAIIWFLVAGGVLTLALFPGLLRGTAELIGVQVPANLLFFVGSLVLLVLTLQHSYELGRLEEKTRTLAEELALLRLEVTEHSRSVTGRGPAPAPAPPPQGPVADPVPPSVGAHGAVSRSAPRRPPGGGGQSSSSHSGS